MRPSDRDTIVAVATPPGEGAVGIVRLSGSRAVEIAAPCFQSGQKLHQVADRRLTYGRFVVGDRDLDEVLVAVMRSPRTYTGEDLVEFNCHGGPLLLRRVVEALVDGGARIAERGEFTRRAFLNGRIDLTQAEAVADLIAARSDLSLRSAYFQLRGGLRVRFESMAEDLRQALALLEAGLDFSEDVEIDPQTVRLPLSRAAEGVDRLIASYTRGKLVRDGALVTLAGRPNVGKSSLLNRLLEEDRAIVTPIPGTTRDTIEEAVTLDGLRITLVDTAGIRTAGNPVEREGTRRSRRSIEQADLVLLVVDASEPPGNRDLRLIQDLQERSVLLVLNKRDLGSHPAWESTGREHQQIPVSALTGQGIDGLRAAVRTGVLDGFPPQKAEVLTHERHVESLRRAGGALSRAEEALRACLPGELVAMELREALDALGEIVGETTSDAILDRIFQTFCIGK